MDSPFDMETIVSTPEETMIDESQDEHEVSLDDAIETLGFGKFHILLLSSIGLLYAAETMEIVINAILTPILQCEWHLSNVQKGMISTGAYVGQGIGAFTWGYLSDKYGRKAVACGSALTAFVFGIASSQASSYWTMLVLRWLTGFGIGGGPTAWVLFAELTSIQRRSKSALVLLFLSTVGEVLTSATAIGVVNPLGWRHYLLIISCPTIIFLLVSWWIPESPRFLLITGQIDRLKLVIDRIAKVNKKDVPKKVKPWISIPPRGRVSDLFTEQFRTTTLLLIIMWFSTAFFNYGIGLLTTQMFQSGIDGCHPRTIRNLTVISENCRRLTNDDYIDFMKTGYFEIPTYLVVFMVIDIIGRKPCLTIAYGLGFLSTMGLLFCSSRTVMVVLISISRGAGLSTIATLYLYSTEIFPTNMRSVSMGCCSLFAKFGSMVTSSVAQVLIHQSFYLVIALYGTSMLLSMISSLLLKKETSQQPLQDQLDYSLKSQAKNYQSFE